MVEGKYINKYKIKIKTLLKINWLKIKHIEDNQKDQKETTGYERRVQGRDPDTGSRN